MKINLGGCKDVAEDAQKQEKDEEAMSKIDEVKSPALF